jgi:hypothetical protein
LDWDQHEFALENVHTILGFDAGGIIGFDADLDLT